MMCICLSVSFGDAWSHARGEEAQGGLPGAEADLPREPRDTPISKNTFSLRIFAISRQIWQILEGSFSAISKPIFASKRLFCSICQALQYLRILAPLQTQG